MIALTLTDDYPDDDFPPFGSGWFYIFFIRTCYSKPMLGQNMTDPLLKTGQELIYFWGSEKVISTMTICVTSLL